ncbi:hypothetical protein Moror_5678 [Moniliophthora roreri MCA 2997]|uniref:Pali-domain-containing protein n=1 Tax=Moniliophthora roreri (strain MCA 2997) TaxID=1381753 RepID=V2WME0_MONRO|nr:hypothetical protein Moror_5678 [Moniliophthora roreri MCA 2997]
MRPSPLALLCDAFRTPTTLLPAFVLLLLGTLCVPVIRSIFIFSTPDSGIRFGIFGYCFSNGTCVSRFNYTLDDNLQFQLSDIPTSAFILHPITCIICFVTFLLSLLRSLALNHISNIKLTLLGLAVLLTACLATATFILDLVVISRLHDVARGNVPFLTLGAAILLWLAAFAPCCGIFGCGRPCYLRGRKPTGPSVYYEGYLALGTRSRFGIGLYFQDLM